MLLKCVIFCLKVKISVHQSLVGIVDSLKVCIEPSLVHL